MVQVGPWSVANPCGGAAGAAWSLPEPDEQPAATTATTSAAVTGSSPRVRRTVADPRSPSMDETSPCRVATVVSFPACTNLHAEKVHPSLSRIDNAAVFIQCREGRDPGTCR